MPEGTQSFAVVCHDPDAPLVDGLTHWVAYGIDGDASGLPEGGADVTTAPTIGNAGLQRPRAAARPRHPPLLLLGLRAARGSRARARPEPRASCSSEIEDLVIEQARLVGTYKNE